MPSTNVGKHPLGFHVRLFLRQKQDDQQPKFFESNKDPAKITTYEHLLNFPTNRSTYETFLGQPLFYNGVSNPCCPPSVKNVQLVCAAKSQPWQ